MSSSSILPSRPVIPQIITTCSSCYSHVEFAIPMNPIPQQGTLLRIRCWKCEKVNEHMFYAAQISSHYPKDLFGNPDHPAVAGNAAASSSSSTTNRNSNPHFSTSGGARKGGRRIGTQERPLETVYYDTLGVPVTATTDEIKKAYRRLAIKHHPDKNPSDPLAADRFKSIAIAYQTLSDPALRAKYNEFGARESAPEGGFVDPEEVFSAIFGGERFVGVIGHISLAKDMKAALQEAEEEAEEGKDGSDGAARIRDGKGERLVLSEEEKAKKEEKNRKKAAERAAARAERVDKLVANLERKLGIFTESATGINDVDVTRSWRTICELEAEELSHESYGPELLQAIGFVYVSKAKQFLATNQTFLGVGGWLHNVQGKYHVFSETVSTLRSALELKSVFDQIQAAEKAGNLSPEERQKLEEQAAEKGLQALFKGAKLEIDSVLREVCDRILLLEAEDPSSSSVGREKAVLRAAALQILGEAYVGVGTRKGGVGIQASSASSADHQYPHSRTSSPAPGTHGKPEPSSTSHSTTSNGGSGLGGIGTGLGNLGRDIGTGLGGMFGFGGGGSNLTTPSPSLSANASPSARRASRTFGGGQGRRGGQGGHGGSFDDSEYVRVDTKSSRARAT